MRFQPASWALSTNFVLRLFGFVYLIAFVSLWLQIDGLLGTSGILPATDYLDRVRAFATQNSHSALALAVPSSELRSAAVAPTLCWWTGASNSSLHALCATGTAASLLLIAGLLPAPLLALLWALYLSLTVVGQTFLGFQWENLLLESGLIAIFLAPPRLRLKGGASAASPLPQNFRDIALSLAPPRLRLKGGASAASPLPQNFLGIALSLPQTIARWLLWWLLFRLMLQSGLVKLGSNDDVWWNLSALTCHYWTQPLPTWIAYYANLLPLWFQKLSVIITYTIELVLPFFIFAPRRLRLIAFWGFTILMILIALTGNYTYFTLLTFVLALTLLDDQSWPLNLHPNLRPNPNPLPPAPSTQHQARSPTLLPLPKIGNRQSAIGNSLLLFSLLFYLSETLPISTLYLHATTHRFFETTNLRLSRAESRGLNLNIRLPPPNPGPATLRRLARWDSFRSVNSYGLFANMTELRPEIILEGSMDGVTWTPYEFRDKPGDPARRPRFVQPHQPRLDWQMWFAALGELRDNPWLVSLMNHLLRNTPAVLDLLQTNPFPDAPPRYLRATIWDYHFTTPAEKSATAQWWSRTNPRPYSPILTLQNNHLTLAPFRPQQN